MNEPSNGKTMPVKSQMPENTMPIQRAVGNAPVQFTNLQPDSTQPIIPSIPGDEPPTFTKKKPRRVLIILVGLFFILLFGMVGGFIGYNVAVQSRLQLETRRNLERAVVQFENAKAEMAAGQYDMARQRLEYVIKLDPNFPGATDMLQQAMIQSAAVMTPTPVITPTLVPTQDTRAVDQIFQTAQQFLRAKEWDSTINSLEAVRKSDRNYRPVDVDGMYYIALRYRGIQKISQGSLEMGIYDLSLTQRFGPLDKEAENYRDWARYYLIGVSFWGVDWAKVVDNFSQLVYSIPNLQDSSHITVSERYRIALISYGDELLAKGDACKARDMYQRALDLVQDQRLIPTATYAQFVCSPPTAIPTNTPVVLPTVTIPIVPTDSATVEPPTAEPPTPEPPTPEPPTVEPPPTDTTAP